MMIGHAWFPDFDPTPERWPSSLSHNIITKFLRDQLGFDHGPDHDGRSGHGRDFE